MVPEFDGPSDDKLSYGIWVSRYIPITIKCSFSLIAVDQSFVVTIGGSSVVESYSGSDLDVVYCIYYLMPGECVTQTKFLS